MKNTLLFLALLISVLCRADEKPSKYFPNAFDADRPSTSFIARAFHQCGDDKQKENHTFGQAVAECSCLGDFIHDHLRMSMKKDEQTRVVNEGKKACDMWLSGITIVEGK